MDTQRQHGRLLLLACLTVAPIASSARAQGTSGEIAPDLRDIAPYMMIIVDSSGSMERLPDCQCTSAACSECLPGMPGTAGGVADGCTLDSSVAGNLAKKKNRWATTLEALTGDFALSNPTQGGNPYAGFGCEKLARTLENGMSYDLGYFMPYHQPWDCANAPPTTPSACDPVGPDCNPDNGDSDCNPFDQRYCNPVTRRCEALIQVNNGILDRYKAQVQFGLMTFDGWDTYVGFPPLVPESDFNTVLSESRSGLWSYGGARSFHYPNCPTNYMMDTGARSEVADEGRLISINSCNPTNCPSWCPLYPTCDPNPENNRASLNDRIQDALLRTRPYGGTPIAGALEDLYYHFKNDLDDGFGGCRGRFGLLITDGYPDDDYRSYGCDCQSGDPTAPDWCDTSGCTVTPITKDNCPNHEDNMYCPYDLPEDIAHDLTHAARPGDAQAPMKQLFVVGLAVDDAVVRDKLNAIALSGGPDDDPAVALFADRPDELVASIAQILEKVIKPIARSVPEFAGGTSSGASQYLASSADKYAAQYQISSGFERTGTGLYAGVIERRRFTCDTPGAAATSQDIAEVKNDRFHKVLDDRSSPRKLLTAVPDVSPNANLRLFCDTGSAPCGASSASTGSCLDPDPNADPACPMEDLTVGLDTTWLGLQGATADADRTKIMHWMHGTGGSARDPSTGAGARRLGDVWHSSPVVVGPPTRGIGDEAYSIFADRVGVKDRPLTLYIGSNDGILHAFAVEPWKNPAAPTQTLQAGEEIFGFVPPLLLDDLQNYLEPYYHQFTMDGTVVVKDVYFERKASPSATAAQYHTVLITGMRNGGAAYVALDVTDPRNPKFLWQYNDAASMGLTFAQPAVVQARYTDGTTVVERAVAILPGGIGQLGALAGECTNGATNPQMRFTNNVGSGVFKTFNTPPGNPSTTATHSHRADIRCWKGVGRSLHFVDVGTGKLIKKIDLDSNGNHIFPSPLVSTPSVYQDSPGTLASRGFVVDADGVIWRIDMSDSSQRPDGQTHVTNGPMNGWTVRPFHDIFWDRGPAQGELSYEAPIVSVDTQGRLVVIVGTGDSNNFTKTNVENRVVSLTEIIDDRVSADNPERYKAAFNWEKRVTSTGGLVPSELVTGRMTLSEGRLFFGTFIPVVSQGDACALGRGRLFAVDYLAKDTSAPNETTPQLYGPLEIAGIDPANTTLFNVSAAEAEQNFLVMGLALTSRPSCTFGGTDLIEDVWGESMSYITSLNQGANATYLVAHASGDQGAGKAIQLQPGSELGSIEVKLQRQGGKLTRILSWATSVD